MHDKMRKLETNVATEKSIRLDLEAEIVEKNTVIAERGENEEWSIYIFLLANSVPEIAIRWVVRLHLQS